MAALVTRSSEAPAANAQPVKHPTYYRTITIDGLSIFYREAGPKDGPTILLLHGLPSSSRRRSSRCSIALPIVTTWWHPTTRVSAIATGPVPKHSRTRSTTTPRS